MMFENTVRKALRLLRRCRKLLKLKTKPAPDPDPTMTQLPPSAPLTAAAALLEQLPLDILEEICEHLAMQERRRSSLFAFSLASKTCYAAAARQRASRICITIRTPDKLRRDLERWEQMLLPRDHYRRVRIVKITGCMSFQESDDNSESNDMEEAARHDEDSHHSWYPYNACEPPRFPVDFEERLIKSLTPEEKARVKEAWIPLAHLLTKLPGLTDFVHACSDQIAPNVLSSLHQNCPQTRLHMHTFSLRSCFEHRSNRPPFLGQPLIDCDSLIDNLRLNDWDHHIDEDDLAIVTSPCLYSIVVKYSSRPRKGLEHGVFSAYEKNYNEAIVKRMVAGLAPRLAHVRMMGYNFLPVGRLPATDPDQNEQSLGPGINLRKGHLKSLTLVGVAVEEPWTLYTTFEMLQLLKIKSLRHPQSLAFLTKLAQQGELGNLRKLSLHLEPKDRFSRDGMPGAVLQLIQSLPWLDTLTLRGALTRELCTGVFQACGKSLRYLALIPRIIQRAPQLHCQELATLSYEDIEELRERLMKLSFPEPRSGICSSNAIAIFNTINDNAENRSLGYLRIFPQDMLRMLQRDLNNINIWTVQRDATGSINAYVSSNMRKATQYIGSTYH
jgi:hypothetical protein